MNFPTIVLLSTVLTTVFQQARPEEVPVPVAVEEEPMAKLELHIDGIGKEMAMDMDMHEYDNPEASATDLPPPATVTKSPVVVEEVQAKKDEPLPEKVVRAK